MVQSLLQALFDSLNLIFQFIKHTQPQRTQHTHSAHTAYSAQRTHSVQRTAHSAQRTHSVQRTHSEAVQHTVY